MTLYLNFGFKIDRLIFFTRRKFGRKLVVRTIFSLFVASLLTTEVTQATASSYINT